TGLRGTRPAKDRPEATAATHEVAGSDAFDVVNGCDRLARRFSSVRYVYQPVLFEIPEEVHQLGPTALGLDVESCHKLGVDVGYRRRVLDEFPGVGAETVEAVVGAVGEIEDNCFVG